MPSRIRGRGASPRGVAGLHPIGKGGIFGDPETTALETGNLTFKEAAREILEDSLSALHAHEIARRVDLGRRRWYVVERGMDADLAATVSSDPPAS